MVAQIGRCHGETNERWRKALERALEAGLEVFVVADTGERMVTSASKFDVLHRTDGVSCTCKAALSGDPICQHRAVLRFVMGWLALPESAATLAMVSCPTCAGRGWVYVSDDDHW